MSVTWERFLRCSRDFLRLSDELNDGWTLEGDANVPGGAYLKKCAFLGGIRWEYHVCYTLSYACPVMYFTACRSNGAPLSLHKVWEICSENEHLTVIDTFTAISQHEHPVLLRPFFMIHPCKTHEFLACSEKCNVTTKFITSVGPIIGLHLDLVYGSQLEIDDDK